jgi:sugar lactone lactonase YvrE
MQSTVMSRRGFLGLGAAVAGAAATGLVPSGAWAGPKPAWPTTIDLPDGLHPGDIGIGRRPYGYLGSLLTGALYRAGLATGEGEMIYAGAEGQMAIGVQVDPWERLWVAGGFASTIRVHDGRTGEPLKSYAVGTAGTTVNHAVVTPGMVWFTDALNPLLFGVPLPVNGSLPAESSVVTLRLSGDWVQSTAPWTVSATGIAPTPDGRALLVVDQAVPGGALFRVDLATGAATQVDLGAVGMPDTNGITVRGRVLYAPRKNALPVFELTAAGNRGRLLREIEDERFDSPCAAGVYGGRLYLPNSRFPLPPTPDTPYNVTSLRLPV